MSTTSGRAKVKAREKERAKESPTTTTITTTPTITTSTTTITTTTTSTTTTKVKERRGRTTTSSTTSSHSYNNQTSKGYNNNRGKGKCNNNKGKCKFRQGQEQLQQLRPQRRLLPLLWQTRPLCIKLLEQPQQSTSCQWTTSALRPRTTRSTYHSCSSRTSSCTQPTATISTIYLLSSICFNTRSCSPRHHLGQLHHQWHLSCWPWHQHGQQREHLNEVFRHTCQQHRAILSATLEQFHQWHPSPSVRRSNFNP